MCVLQQPKVVVHNGGSLGAMPGIAGANRLLTGTSCRVYRIRQVATWQSGQNTVKSPSVKRCGNFSGARRYRSWP
jgi:hypothetical protein